jgi:hypothetical protein
MSTDGATLNLINMRASFVAGGLTRFGFFENIALPKPRQCEGSL